MRYIPIICLVALLLPATSVSGVPTHPSQSIHHRQIVQLCDRAAFTMHRLPAGKVIVTVGAWVNGQELTSQLRGETLWFYGGGISGRMNVLHDTTLRVQAARFSTGCVRFVVAWWRSR